MFFRRNFKPTACTLLMLVMFSACNKPSSSGENDTSTQTSPTEGTFEINFPGESQVYNSPLIYIKDDSDELRISEKGGVQTTYGYDDNSDNSSLFKTIPFTISPTPKDLNLKEELSFLLVSNRDKNQHFCQDIKFKFVDNTLEVSVRKAKEKLFSAAICTFQLGTKIKNKIKTNKSIFNFYFNYTFKDWESKTQAKEIQHTIKAIHDLKNIVTNRKDISRIQYLNLNKKNITDISPLLSLIDLESLLLSDNQIKDIPDLSNFKNLKVLHLENNQLKEFKGVSNLTKLTSLVLSGNQITDIPDLSNLKALNYLELKNNKIENISPNIIAQLKKIKTVDIKGNPGDFPDFKK